MEKYELTKSGRARIEETLRDLIDNQRPNMIDELKAAREQGDLSENADYDAARKKQAEIEAKINSYQYILDNCVIITKSKKDSHLVSLGDKVTLYNHKTQKSEVYSIVGTVEADPREGKISDKCVLGASLIGKKVGDIVEIKAKNSYTVEILDFNF